MTFLLQQIFGVVRGVVGMCEREQRSLQCGPSDTQEDAGGREVMLCTMGE